MALIGMDGFDQYATGDVDTDTNPLWRRAEENRYYTTPTPPYGRGAILGIYDYGDLYTKPLGSLTGTIITGFHWRTNAIDEGNTFYWNSSAGTSGCQVYLGTETAANGGGFGLYRGWRGTLITRSTTTNPSYALTTNQWYWIEIKVKVDDSTGIFELRVNGDVWIDYSGDTRNDATNAGIDQFGFSTSNNDWNYIDNFFIADTSTANNAQVYDFQGPSEIITLYPSSDTATINWSRSAGTTNSENIDEEPASNTDYVYTDTSGDVDVYNYGDLPAGNWAVKAVQPMARTEMQEPGTATMTISTGNNTDANITVDPAGNVQYVSTIFETENGTTAWTAANVNSLTVSYEYD